MSHHDLPQAFVAGGHAGSGGSVETGVRLSLRLAFPVPPTEHGDARFAALLDALARRTSHARQIAGENIPAL